MNINYKVASAVVGAVSLIATSAVVVSCGGGSGAGGGSGGNNNPAPVATRDVNISCGGGAGEATLNTTANPVTATATLTGNQQSPPVCTGALGTGTVTVDTTTGAITGSISGLNGFGTTISAAHIHDAEDGDKIIISLTANGSGGFDVPPSTMLSSTQLAHFTNGSLYYNVHTTANPNGEIRGQIGRSIYTAAMTGKQAGTSATGKGNGRVVLNPETKTADVSFSVSGLTGESTAGHIHVGAVNVQGGAVVVPMNPTSAGGTTYTMSGVDFSAPSNGGPQTLLDDLKAGNLYFNVHTMANVTGEIRGQIGRAVRFAETFSGANQVPTVTSGGSGSGFAVLNVAARTVSGAMSISNLTPTMSHIHEGAVGANGNIVVNFTPLTSTTPTATDQAVSATVAKEFLDDKTYMNVHTATNTAGEIRGQLDIP